MSYKELLEKILEMTGPPEGMNQSVYDNDELLKKNILGLYSEEEIHDVMQKIGLDIRKFFIGLLNGEDPFELEDGMDALLEGKADVVESFELTDERDIGKVMENIREGKDPLDGVEGRRVERRVKGEQKLEGDPKELTDKMMQNILKKAGGSTH